jgi:hypothetical protein
MTLRKSVCRKSVVLAAAAALALSGCASGDDEVDTPFAEDQNQELNEEQELSEDNQLEPDDEAGEDDGSAVDDEPNASVDPGVTLTSVSIRDIDVDDERQEFTEFCFGGTVNRVGDESGFALLGVDPTERVQAETAVLDEDDANCVVAGFPAGTDLAGFSVGTVDYGVVQTRENELNVQDSAAIAGGSAEAEGRRGATNAPELLRVSIDPSLEQARFVFDEELGEQAANANAQAFGFYTSDGTARTAQAVASAEDRDVVVTFEGTQLEDAARFFVLPGAVTDRQGTQNNLGAIGSRTAAPDLVDVSRNSPSQYDFRFDEPVNAPEQANRFFLYTTDAEALTGETVTRPGPNTVRVVFRPAMEIDNIVRGAVAPNAVTGLNGGLGSASTIGAARLAGGGGDQGATAGPDLVDVVLEPDTGRATFVFDETLEEQSPNPRGFSLITSSGDVRRANEIVNVIGGEVTGNSVVVLFDEAAAQAAALASVSTGAVQDLQGNPNPVDTTGISASG